MKLIHTEVSTSILSIARGEEVFETVLAWCREQHIVGAHFTGIGAADQLDVAYYHLPTKKFERTVITEEVEILSLIGNVGVLDGKTLLHMHGVFGRRDLSTFGGHLFRLRISGACEIHLTALSSSLPRAFDEATGLNLLCPHTTAIA